MFGDIAPEPGMTLMSDVGPFNVVSVEGDTVTVDFNHNLPVKRSNSVLKLLMYVRQPKRSTRTRTRTGRDHTEMRGLMKRLTMDAHGGVQKVQLGNPWRPPIPAYHARVTIRAARSSTLYSRNPREHVSFTTVDHATICWVFICKETNERFRLLLERGQKDCL